MSGFLVVDLVHRGHVAEVPVVLAGSISNRPQERLVGVVRRHVVSVHQGRTLVGAISAGAVALSAVILVHREAATETMGALLRRKGLILTRDFGSPAWIHTRRAASRIRETWATAAPVCDWLDRHVGPSTLPPDDRPF